MNSFSSSFPNNENKREDPVPKPSSSVNLVRLSRIAEEKEIAANKIKQLKASAEEQARRVELELEIKLEDTLAKIDEEVRILHKSFWCECLCFDNFLLSHCHKLFASSQLAGKENGLGAPSKHRWASARRSDIRAYQVSQKCNQLVEHGRRFVL